MEKLGHAVMEKPGHSVTILPDFTYEKIVTKPFVGPKRLNL